MPPGTDGQEWNPTEESLAPVRGRHRVARQRGGTMARSSAVLGVGVMAAVGAGGMASAKDRPAPPITVPDLGHVADQVQRAMPDTTKDLPALGTIGFPDAAAGQRTTAAHPDLTAHGPATAAQAATGVADAGEALRARILRQAEAQRLAAEEAEREAAAKAAAEQAAKEAAKRRAEDEARQKAAEQEAARKAAEAARQAEEAARRQAEADRAVTLAGSYALPVSSYTLTAGFGQAGDMWSANHTGQDFAAPTGTPVKAVHGGTITEAGWAGSYGYRVVLTLPDGTELWYCHLSSMVRTAGTVTTGDVLGRVGATGNVTGPHLHLEVRPGGGEPVDPLAWLRQHGLTP
ncbi:M23 family metallopeptidase [Streptomyces sp. B1866]|uniref:M23 family metallopeptidase n=1 Tax=Streptomyces sp. B1866 TaxID=3075431 RepID=UPI00288F76D1|nr:M23 family metallopeptidase [Streptomyces sp. B1866]MDT3395559.1 M23 family metallopeptidase [Streptomyces sp. B1866]